MFISTSFGIESRFNVRPQGFAACPPAISAGVATSLHLHRECCGGECVRTMTRGTKNDRNDRNPVVARVTLSAKICGRHDHQSAHQGHGGEGSSAGTAGGRRRGGFV